jgi:hypothetical protein
MLDAARTLISTLEDIGRALLILICLFTVIKVAFKTSFALVPMIGVIAAVWFVNWAIGNISWASNLFNKDAQKLSSAPAPAWVRDREPMTADSVVRLRPPAPAGTTPTAPSSTSDAT